MQTFDKKERLCGKKKIDFVFTKGKKLNEEFILVIWMESQSVQSFPIEILISVPKRNFPKANERNLIKRRMREAFRKQKHEIYDYLSKREKCLQVVLIYTKNKIAPYSEIAAEINSVLNRLKKML